MITAENVHDLFECRDGKLFWKITVNNRALAGSEAGHQDSTQGYRRITYAKKKWMAHRIVYLMHHGEWPEICDHIDQDPTNNRIENLRSCTKAENNLNNKCAGVVFDRRANRWYATYRSRHFGCYPTKALALARRRELEIADPQHLRTEL